MGSIKAAFATVFRDFVLDGVSSSGLHEPEKPTIRAIGQLIEQAIGNAAFAGLSSFSKATRADLEADLAHDAGTVALVFADPVDRNNDLYVKTGASAAGSWTLTSILHQAADAALSGGVAEYIQPHALVARQAADEARVSASMLSAASALSIAENGSPFFYSRFGTRYIFGVQDDLAAAFVAPHIYIDPFNGNDSNSGDTIEDALRTCAGLLDHPLMGVNGTGGSPTIITDLTIGIVGHPTGIIRDQFDFWLQNAENGYRQLHRCSFVKVGSAPVRFDCMDPAPPANFTAHGSIANAYTISWSHKMNGTTTTRIRVRRRSDGRPYKRVASLGALVPGTYYMAGSPVYGTNAEITVIAFDSGDMRTAGREVDITRRDVAISVRSGLIQGIWGEWNGHNNGSIYAFDGLVSGSDPSGAVGAPSAMIDCLLYQGTKHHMVCGNGLVAGVNAINSIDNEFDHDGGGAAYLTTFESLIAGKTAKLVNCGMLVDTSIHGPSVDVGQTGTNITAWLTHDGVANSGPSFVEMTDCTVWGMNGGLGFGLSRGSLVRGLFFGGHPTYGATASAVAAQGGNGRIKVTRSVIGPVGRFIEGQDIVAHGNLFISAGGFGGAVTTVNQPGRIDYQNNIFVSEPAQSFVAVDIINTGTLIMRRNLIAQSQAATLSPYNASPSPLPVVDSNFNVWESVGGNEFFISYLNENLTFPNWKLENAAFDPNSVKVTDAVTQFVSGLLPTMGNLDVRLSPDSEAADRMTDLLTQAEVDQMLRRPKTYAECIAYYNQAPNSAPVWLG